jgi:hypothetical protein
MGRRILGVFAGIIAAILIFTAFEYFRLRTFPPPPGYEKANHQQQVDYFQSLPTTALVIDLAGWITGSFLCGLLIRIISRSANKSPAYIAGLFLMTAGIVDLFVIPYPVWFIIAGLLVFIPFTLLGHSVMKNKIHN